MAAASKVRRICHPNCLCDDCEVDLHISDSHKCDAPGDFQHDEWLRMLCDTRSEYQTLAGSPKLRFSHHCAVAVKSFKVVVVPEPSSPEDWSNTFHHNTAVKRAHELCRDCKGVTWFDFDWKSKYERSDLRDFVLCIASRSTEFYIGVTTCPLRRMTGKGQEVFQGPPIPVHESKYSDMNVLCSKGPKQISDLEKYLIEYARTEPDISTKCMNLRGGGGHISRQVQVWFLYVCYNLDVAVL